MKAAMSYRQQIRSVRILNRPKQVIGSDKSTTKEEHSAKNWLTKSDLV